MYVSDCIQIIILSYTLGSIPFGILLAKMFRLPDPRYIGSGNIGATNMLRTGRKDVALMTLLLDGGKGALAVWLTYQLFAASDLVQSHSLSVACEAAGEISCIPHYILEPGLAALAVLTAAVGHMYSPWLKFKGGKGMATMLGGTLAFSWPVGMAALITWLIVVFLTRFVSLGSIAALAVAPLIAWLRVDATSAFIIAIGSGIAIWKHRENIKRLRAGFEPRISLGKGDKK